MKMRFEWESVVLGLMGFFGILLLIILIAYYKECKKSLGDERFTLKFLLALIVFLTILPLVISLLVVFAIYAQTISLILKLRYLSDYAGLLEGTDAIHTIEGKSKNVGNILFIIRYNPTHKQGFYETVRQAILEKFEKNSIKTPKLWFALRDFMGYSYYVKNQIKPEDCISKLERLDEEELAKSDCVKLVSKYSNRKLPKNHTAMWECLIGEQPVRWKRWGADSTELHYPVVLRIHHCLSDAASFVKVFVRIFGDAKTIPIPSSPGDFNFRRTSTTRSAKVNEKITIKLPTTKAVSLSSKPLTFVWNTTKLTLKSLYVLIMVPPILLVQNIIKASDGNSLHGAKMSGQKVFAHGSEERSHYIHGIKHIKNRISDTAYPDILFAAISASFEEYFKETFNDVPKSIAGLVPLFPPPSQLPHFIPESPDVRKIVCRNIFSLAVLKLPLIMETGKENAKTRLEVVKEQIDIFKNALDYKVNYLVLMLFVGILPYALRKPISKMLHCTFIISIVPAPRAMTILGGYQVDDVMFWVPNIGAMGVGFSVLSYDRRLQIGLIADKNLIPEEKNAQKIIDGIYKYLDLLNLETDFSRV